LSWIANRYDSSQSLNANVPGGKLNRGLSVLDTGLALLKRPLTEKEFRDLSILGWLAELLQAFLLISDDIIDGSLTRRGQPCWYLQSGLIAINDCLLIESLIYVTLKRHFTDHAAYIDLIHLFHDITYQTELGQLCDLITSPANKIDLDNFTTDKYIFIARNKTAYYSF
jgi:farnesyl diphosphate synthase